MTKKKTIQQLMTGTPASLENQVTLENWTLPPYNRWGFRNLRCLMPTAAISRGAGPAARLHDNKQGLGDIQFAGVDGKICTVQDFLARSFTDGLLVIHRGEVVFEEHCDGFKNDCRHIVFSISKSVLGILAGVLMEQRLFDRSDSIADIIPELKKSGWRDAKVEHVLDMTSGVDFVEDYEDRNGDVWALRRILYRLAENKGAGSLKGVLDYLQGVGPGGRHGRQFTYKSADTMVLAWIIERTTGRHLPELISTEIWSKLGAESDAYVMLDAKGVAYGAGGVCTTLRDLGRFGLMVANGGAANGRQIVPEAWIAQCRSGDKTAFRKSTLAERFPNGAYKNQWWLRDADAGIQLAIGIHGQMIYIDRDRELVVVKLSSWPSARLPDVLSDTVSAIEAISAQL